MKYLFLFIFFLHLAIQDVYAQQRLDPADSSLNQNWFQDHPWGFMLTTSAIWGPSAVTGYSNMFNFLGRVDVGAERVLDLMSMGIQVRRQKWLMEFHGSFSVFVNDRPVFSRGGSTSVLYQDIYNVGVNLGYVIYSNSRISVIPRLGVGISNFTVQYSDFPDDEVFDFIAPRATLYQGSPRLFHNSAHLDVAFDIIYGLQGARGLYAIEGLRVGFRTGFVSQEWETSQGVLANNIVDRSGEIYINLIFGLSNSFKRKSK